MSQYSSIVSLNLRRSSSTAAAQNQSTVQPTPTRPVGRPSKQQQLQNLTSAQASVPVSQPVAREHSTPSATSTAGCQHLYQFKQTSVDLLQSYRTVVAYSMRCRFRKLAKDLAGGKDLLQWEKVGFIFRVIDFISCRSFVSCRFLLVMLVKILGIDCMRVYSVFTWAV